jgi:hypothetical protein
MFSFLLIKFFSTEFLHNPPLHIGSETANPTCEFKIKLGTFAPFILGHQPILPKLPKIKGELNLEKNTQNEPVSTKYTQNKSKSDKRVSPKLTP